MTGRLSDRPMIRAASIPHLGQTTPTAALGLRPIRSLLTRLDANGPPTVLNISTLSGNESLFVKRSPLRETMQEPPLEWLFDPTFVDTTAPAPTFLCPRIRAVQSA